jgi:hypothetical protein
VVTSPQAINHQGTLGPTPCLLIFCSLLVHSQHLILSALQSTMMMSSRQSASRPHYKQSRISNRATPSSMPYTTSSSRTEATPVPSSNARNSVSEASRPIIGSVPDLSNLCLPRKSYRDGRLALESSPLSATQTKGPRTARSIYPSFDTSRGSSSLGQADVTGSFETSEQYIAEDTDLTVDEIFAMVEEQLPLHSQCRQVITRDDSHARSGTTGTVLDPNDVRKPAPPAWVDTATHTARTNTQERSFKASPQPHWDQSDQDQQPPSLAYLQDSSSSFSAYGDGTTREWEESKGAGKPVETVTTRDVEVIHVEVEPGVFLPLRGSEETLRAMAQGTTRLVQCLSCEAPLACVPDCQMVICPDCRVVSPILDEEQNMRNAFLLASKTGSPLNSSSVGLGWKMRT